MAAAAAAFLRVSPEAVMRLVVHSKPCPAVRSKGSGGFSAPALADWLRESGKAVLLSQAGAFADDESLAEVPCARSTRTRGRPEVEEG